MASADVEFRCFVGGFHYRTDEKDLERAFSKFGHVIDSKIIRNPVTGRSRDFGFITFKEEKSMRDAIKEMNGRKLDGSILDPKDVKFECFVGDLLDGTNEKDLERFLSVFSKVIDSEDLGNVTFKDEKSMWNAIKRVDDIFDDEEPNATSITNGDEIDFYYTSVKKSNRSDYRVITVKEAWPCKPRAFT